MPFVPDTFSVPQFDQAVAVARQAVDLLKKKKDAKGVERVKRQLAHYLRGEPFRDRPEDADP